MRDVDGLGGQSGQTVRALKLLGANNAYADYYTEKPVFANVIHQAGPFRAFNQSEVGAALDADEWPTEDFSQTLFSFVNAPDSPAPSREPHPSPPFRTPPCLPLHTPDPA